MPILLTRMFKQAGLKQSSVFVDLGSGVGNAVLQAALQFGCESWGAEISKHAADLGDAQAHEMKARAR